MVSIIALHNTYRSRPKRKLENPSIYHTQQINTHVN